MSGESTDVNRSSGCCSKPCHAWSSCNRCFHGVFEKFFGGLGSRIARFPWVTIIVSLCIVGACSAGFYKLKLENRTVKLFVPQNSQAIKDLEKANRFFPSLDTRDEFVIFIPKDGGNALQKNCLQDVIDVHEEIVALSDYMEFCAPRQGNQASSVESCNIANPLEIFKYAKSNLVNITEKLTAAYNDPTYTLQTNRPFRFNFNQMLSNVKWNKTTGLIQSAEAIQVVYLMRNPSDETENEKVIKWEKTLIDKIASLQSKMACTTLYYAAERSIDDAITESSGSDITLISITFTIMITFASVMLGNFCNPVMGHSILANAGILAVALGILAGFGLIIFVGIPFTSIVGILPFLILGIGIDDMFIIVDEIDRQDNQLSVVETVKMVMARTGATVTMTTMTDLVAFAVSTSTEFPSVRYFCIYAAVSVTFSYLLIITFFVAFASFDIRRIKANRRDCHPICFAPPPPDGEPAWDEPRPQGANRIMKAWAKFLMLPPVRILVVLLSLGLLAAGIYGALNISENFDRKILAKDNSYYKQFIAMQEKLYDTSLSVSIVIEGKPKYETSKVQDQVIELSTIVTQNEHYKNTTISWMKSLKFFAEVSRINTIGNDFLPALNAFLNHPAYSHFRQDIALSSDNQTIEASRIVCVSKSSTKSSFQRDMMVTLRKDFDTKSELSAYPIAKFFIFFEQYVIIGPETLRNLIIASLTVLVITWPFLLSIIVTLLVFFSFVSLIVELFGLMVIWNVTLNSVSMINLVMAIGFSVDYSAHIAHAFATSTESTAEARVEHALSNMGASVIMGGVTTFLGMVVTAFASSEIFRIFFKMFLGIVLLGLVHGLCILPVYLSLFCRWSCSKQAQVQSTPNTSIQNQGYSADNDIELSKENQLHDNVTPI